MRIEVKIESAVMDEVIEWSFGDTDEVRLARLMEDEAKAAPPCGHTWVPDHKSRVDICAMCKARRPMSPERYTELARFRSAPHTGDRLI